MKHELVTFRIETQAQIDAYLSLPGKYPHRDMVKIGDYLVKETFEDGSETWGSITPEWCPPIVLAVLEARDER